MAQRERICLPMQEMQETQVRPLGWEDFLEEEMAGGGKISWRRKWQPTPGFLPGKFHRQRSLVGFCPWDHTELDATEHTRTHMDFIK